MLSDRGVLALFVLAPVFYGLLPATLPWPDRPQRPDRRGRSGRHRTQPRADPGVGRAWQYVDRTASHQLSRSGGRDLRAPRVRDRRHPTDTERNVLKGVQARLPIYAEFDLLHPVQPRAAGHAERYRPMRRTPSSAARGPKARRADRAAPAAGGARHGAAVQSDRILFRYVVPAAFVLILHQTLLMGAAMLGGAAFERAATAGGRGVRRRDPRTGPGALDDLRAWDAALLRHHASGLRVLDARQHLGDSRRCPFPFILATSFLGQALGLVFRHRETAVLLVLASSLPQFFLVGVSWPAEALPACCGSCANCCRA